MKLVFASTNENKVKEIRAKLPEEIELVSLGDLNHFEDLEETANTLEDNSLMKAKFVWDKFKLACFADDSGLEIDALNGAPGVFSARYAGEQKNSDDNCNKVLAELKNIENRKAQFRTVISLIIEGETHVFEGSVLGKIGMEKKGTSGFGYDPIFIPNDSNFTFAEMSMEEKNKNSHRTKAVLKMLEFLNTHI